MVGVVVRDVGFSRLRADAVEAAKSRALLVVVVIVAIHVSRVAN